MEPFKACLLSLAVYSYYITSCTVSESVRRTRSKCLPVEATLALFSDCAVESNLVVQFDVAPTPTMPMPLDLPSSIHGEARYPLYSQRNYNTARTAQPPSPSSLLPELRCSSFLPFSWQAALSALKVPSKNKNKNDRCENETVHSLLAPGQCWPRVLNSS